MNLFKKKSEEYRATSLSELIWQRFMKEKEGLIFLDFIIFVVIIALLGYLITPDEPPHCNHQQFEIALCQPGTSVLMLQTHPEQEIEKVGVFHKMPFGQASTSPFPLTKVFDITGFSNIINLK